METLEEQINNLNDNAIISEQKEVKRLLARKEIELNIKQDRWHQALERNSKIYKFSIALVIFFLVLIALVFLYFQKKQLEHTQITRASVVYVLGQIQDNLKLKTKTKKGLEDQLKIVNYKKKKYYKILKTDFMLLKSQPKYQYLEVK